MAELEIEGRLAELAVNFETAQDVTSAFRAELSGVQLALQGTDREARTLSRSLGSSLRSAFEGLVFDGEKVGDVLLGLGKSLASNVLTQSLAPVQNALGTGLSSLVSGGLGTLFSGLMPFEKGAAFSGGRVRAFASGGIVESPTHFPMRGGAGLMGEAGPEAIMPLARGADGKLGVRGGGGRSVNVTMNISTPNVEGFQRSRAQVAANVSRALKRGQRNL